jgi:hypothetical protein
MTLPTPGPGRPQHPDLDGKGRSRAELASLYCTCETRADPGCPVHGLRRRGIIPARIKRGVAWAVLGTIFALGAAIVIWGIVVICQQQGAAVGLGLLAIMVVPLPLVIWISSWAHAKDEMVPPPHDLRLRHSHRGFWLALALGLATLVLGVGVERASATYPGPECTAALERVEAAGEDPAVSAEAEAICNAEWEATRAAEAAEEEAEERGESRHQRYPHSHRLPTVTRKIAERMSRKALHKVQSWRRAEVRELDCRRLNRTRWRCRALWYRRGACEVGRLRVDGVNPHGRPRYVSSGEFLEGWGYLRDGRIRCPFYR